MPSINKTDGQMPSIVLPEYVRALTEVLEAAGEEAYLVGGSLRDLLLGQVPHDYDLATSAPPRRTADIFSEEYRVIETGLKHGTVTVLSEGKPVEITTFRIDGSYTDGRHPDAVSFTDRIVDDLSRRDFTVNAMAYRDKTGLLDPFGGRADLTDRLLRAVGEPVRRFSEDALRILRAFRFSAQLGFVIEEATLEGIGRCKEGLERIAKERIAAEFLKLLCAKSPAPALRAMRDGGVLPYVIGDYCPKEAIIDKLATMPAEDTARLGLFFADTDTARAAELLRGLRLSNKQIAGACAVLRGSAYEVRTPADARRLIAASGVWASMAVRAAVLLGNAEAEAIGWVEKNNAPCQLSDLAISGRDLLAVGIRGKDVGKTLLELLSAVMNDPSLNQKELLLEMIKKGL